MRKICHMTCYIFCGIQLFRFEFCNLCSYLSQIMTKVESESEIAFYGRVIIPAYAEISSSDILNFKKPRLIKLIYRHHQYHRWILDAGAASVFTSLTQFHIITLLYTINKITSQFDLQWNLPSLTQNWPFIFQLIARLFSDKRSYSYWIHELHF